MKIKCFICLMLAVILLVTMASCVPTTPTREKVTEDPPVRNPEDVVIETTASAQSLEGIVKAICGDDLIRIRPSGEYTQKWGEDLYIRTSEIENACEGDLVWVTYDTIERSKNPDDAPVIIAKTIKIEVPDAKPVIYLYPETPTEVSVKLSLDGHLTCTYPDYTKGWDGFTAHPDGTLIFPDGKEYYCLYWEGMQAAEWDFSEGFCVKGEDTAAFLEWALAAQGLTPREANEFIIYWLPLMQENSYNMISFQTETYTDGALLDITPAPDSLIRVFMAFFPTETAVEMVPQVFEMPVRDGFTVVEWGGSQARES